MLQFHWNYFLLKKWSLEKELSGYHASRWQEVTFLMRRLCSRRTSCFRCLFCKAMVTFCSLNIFKYVHGCQDQLWSGCSLKLLTPWKLLFLNVPSWRVCVLWIHWSPGSFSWNSYLLGPNETTPGPDYTLSKWQGPFVVTGWCVLTGAELHRSTTSSS